MDGVEHVEWCTMYPPQLITYQANCKWQLTYCSLTCSVISKWQPCHKPKPHILNIKLLSLTQLKCLKYDVERKRKPQCNSLHNTRTSRKELKIILWRTTVTNFGDWYFKLNFSGWVLSVYDLPKDSIEFTFTTLWQQILIIKTTKTV